MAASDLPFVVIGGGGHSKVVIDALKACYKNIYAIFEDKEIIDNNKSILGIAVQKTPPTKWWHDNLVHAIIAIGSNQVRQRISKKLYFVKWGSAIHPSALVHKSAIIGEGVYIGANVVIQPNAIIGDHCIINTGAIIEHDVVIKDYCHIAPGSVITGHVNVGTGTLVGAGTIIIPEINIGSWCIIGGGSVVVKNIGDFQKAFGNPCKEISIVSF